MPLNGYSVGRDWTVTVQLATGPLTLNKLLKFDSKQDATDVRVKRLDGITDHVRFFDGWTGSFEVERADSTVDNLFALLEANYYLGINETPAQIYETVAEVNGAVSQFRFDGCMLTYDDAGQKAGDATVKQKITFKASRRVKVS